MSQIYQNKRLTNQNNFYLLIVFFYINTKAKTNMEEKQKNFINSFNIFILKLSIIFDKLNKIICKKYS